MMSVVALATLGVLALFAYAGLYASKSIYELLGENRELKQAITNLTHEDQIGYARVLGQEERDGRLFTRLLFVVTARGDLTVRLIEKEYEIEGDVIHFDALIVRFGPEVVMDGKEKALYLWRRVYGEMMPPETGFPIEEPGAPPARYADLSARLSLRDRNLFWEEIWALSDDPERLRAAGVRAIYGNVVYKRLQPGLIYIFRIDATGGVFPEVVPAL
jgi:hypothetical protein